MKNFISSLVFPFPDNSHLSFHFVPPVLHFSHIIILCDTPVLRAILLYKFSGTLFFPDDTLFKNCRNVACHKRAAYLFFCRFAPNTSGAVGLCYLHLIIIENDGFVSLVSISHINGSLSLKLKRYQQISFCVNHFVVYVHPTVSPIIMLSQVVH